MDNIDAHLIFEAYNNRTDKQVIQEGFFDRAKANVSGAVGSVKGLGQQVAGTVKGAVAGAKGNVAGVQQAAQQVQAGKTSGAIAKAESYKATALQKIDKLTAEIMADLGKLGIDPGALNSANNSFKKNLANSLNALITGLKTPAPAAPAPAAPAPAAQPAPVAQPAPAAPTPSP